MVNFFGKLKNTLTGLLRPKKYVLFSVTPPKYIFFAILAPLDVFFTFSEKIHVLYDGERSSAYFCTSSTGLCSNFSEKQHFRYRTITFKGHFELNYTIKCWNKPLTPAAPRGGEIHPTFFWLVVNFFWKRILKIHIRRKIVTVIRTF